MRLQIKPAVQLSNDQKIEAAFDQYINWYLKDIKKIAATERAPVSALILCFTMLDALSGLYAPSEKNGTRFKKFVCKYLSQYNAYDMWKILRNGLIHSYSIKKRNGQITYALRDDHEGHFDAVPVIDSDGKELYRAKAIELNRLITDIETALKNFKMDAHTEPFKSRVIKHITKEGIIKSV